MTTSTEPTVAAEESQPKPQTPEEAMAQSARDLAAAAAAVTRDVMDRARAKHVEDEQTEASMLAQARGRANT